jgi:uncharacterized membrane protein
MPTIETFIDVNVPMQTAYDQWKQFEKFSPLMESVKQGNRMTTYNLSGKPRIVRKGVVTFLPISDVMSTVQLQLAYTPEAVVENEEDGVEVLSVRIRKELKRFKAFVELCGQSEGNWLARLPYRAFF